MTLRTTVVSWIGLPSAFKIFNFGVEEDVKNWELFFSVATGLWAGYWVYTEYYTSNAYSLVQDVDDSCGAGAATCFGIEICHYLYRCNDETLETRFY
ncbi:pyrophosphate-energized vacuolar membrane proton pump-like [Tasmannia lanceolata]|uniref:pyrophosphate-energized vacuolar membrane proton pump-like n=1 Tax=Tasmannia lanceolata TaxID=3420 RepID=UPI0040630EB6